MIDISNINNQINFLSNSISIIDMLERENKQLVEELHELNQKREDTINFIKLNEDSISIFRTLMTHLSEYGIGVIKKMIDNGLSVVYPDRDYEIKIEVTDLRGLKNLTFKLIEIKEDKSIVETTVNGRHQNGVGEGIKTVISIILQVYYILYSNKLRFLILDEALSTLHPDYLRNLFDLFTSLNKEFNFNFLLITNSKSVLEYADFVYKVDKGYVSLIDKKEIE